MISRPKATVLCELMWTEDDLKKSFVGYKQSGYSLIVKQKQNKQKETAIIFTKYKKQHVCNLYVITH